MAGYAPNGTTGPMENVLSRLDGVRRTRSGWEARCPSHEDRQPSLSISYGSDGRVLLNCFANCNTEDIVAALGLRMSDLFAAGEARNGAASLRPVRPRRERTAAREIGRRRYEIREPDGTLAAIHVRIDFDNGTKRVFWEGPNGEDGLGGRGVETLPVFGSERLADLPDGATVVIAEGEPATQACWRAGLDAVGTVTGAGGDKAPSAEVLGGLRRFDIVLWPDADATGRQHMALVAERLIGLEVGPRLVEWADAPPKGDAADVPGGAEEIRALVAAARPYVPSENQRSPEGAPSSGPPMTSARTVRLSDVAARPVEWLWPGRIPRGKLTVVDGDPGLGKSTFTLDIAARVTTGSPMPDGSRSDLDGPAAVVLLSAEDGLDDTIRPRLDAAGADARRVVALVGVSAGDPDRPERLPTLDDIVEIETAVRANGAALVIVDPVMAFMPGRADSSKDQDVRSVLARLARLAEDTGAAIIVVRHLNKSQQANALYRGGGSIGIIGAARSGLLVARDPGDPTGARRIVALTKSNLAALAQALAYRLLPDENGNVRVAWEGPTDYTADDLLAQPSSAEERTATDEAMEWLKDALREGERPASDVQREARKDGLSDKCLRLARQRLGVKIAREGFGQGSRWMWSLQQDDAEPPRRVVGRSSIDALAPPLMPDVPAQANGASMAVEGIYGARENGVAPMAAAWSDADVATGERNGAPGDDAWGEV